MNFKHILIGIFALFVLVIVFDFMACVYFTNKAFNAVDKTMDRLDK